MPVHNPAIDTEYLILENIYGSGEQKKILRQRDLAHKTGTSLGMTNAILRRLAQKGWITIKKLNCRNIQYAVTLEGINEIIYRSYNYFKQTIRNAVYYKEKLDKIIKQAKSSSISAVVLIGASDLDFIIEHACQCCGISFLKAAGPDTANTNTANTNPQNTLRIYSETINYLLSTADNCENVLYLSKLLIANSGFAINDPELLSVNKIYSQ
ncbi:MAG: MarR family transcriptional regulator [Treponema sp.]|nr:MarR family transcriptional regulator [Treponema sp.]